MVCSVPYSRARPVSASHDNTLCGCPMPNSYTRCSSFGTPAAPAAGSTGHSGSGTGACAAVLRGGHSYRVNCVAWSAGSGAAAVRRAGRRGHAVAPAGCACAHHVSAPRSTAVSPLPLAPLRRWSLDRCAPPSERCCGARRKLHTVRQNRLPVACPAASGTPAAAPVCAWDDDAARRCCTRCQTPPQAQ